MSNVTERTTCRLCGNQYLITALQLEPIPLGDDFVSEGQRARLQPLFDLVLKLCQECGQVQLSQVVNPDMIYRDYVYTTSVSHGLTAHFEAYAHQAMARCDKPGLAVEIGSNEGAMLRVFKAAGWRVLGIDPARSIAAQAAEGGIETWAEYFSASLAQTIRAQRGPAQLIIANNVMANIDDLDDLAAGIRSLLAPEGLFVFETSYWLDVVEKTLLDTIFSEHVSYFSVGPLFKFFDKHGLELIDVERTAPKGGSLRGYVQLAGGPHARWARVGQAMDEEKLAGLLIRETYLNFEARLGKIYKSLGLICGRAHEDGKRLAAWGAADGPTTLIYQFGLGEYLDCIFDDNPVKIGTYSPGMHLLVLSGEALKTRKPDVVLLLAWRYADEIIRAHPDYKGEWVVPLPTVKVRR